MPGRIRSCWGLFRGDGIEMVTLYQRMRNAFYSCDTIEFIDRPDFPLESKLKIIEGLDIKNKTFGTYKKIYASIKPLILKVNKEELRPFRILELAGGVGDLSLGLYHEIKKDKNRPEIEITHSDIVDAYIKIASKKFAKSNAVIESKIIDALDLDSEEDKKWDLVITLHSLHHFKPKQLDLLFKRSLKTAKYGIFSTMPLFLPDVCMA